MEKFIAAIQGREYLLHLPEIWIVFEHLGVITWVFFIFGVYISFIRGGSLKRTISISAIAFIVLIALYDQFNYGLPIIYDRTFMYLYVVVTIVAAIGLSEIRRLIKELKDNKRFKNYTRSIKYLDVVTPISVGIVIIVIAVPAHMDIGYYKMISENDYETFIWIDENIDNFRDVNHSYDKAAVHPFKASPFSAITGLYIVSSNMHPTRREDLWAEMEDFVVNGCLDTGFLDRHKMSVVYGYCLNDNLTMIYPSVYLYPGLYDDDDIVLDPGSIS